MKGVMKWLSVRIRLDMRDTCDKEAYKKFELKK
jgi:hypothetical protein